MNNINVNQALEFARQLLPVSCNPYELCDKVKIEIITDKPMHKDGYLVCESGCKLIFVSSRITNAHRRKFIVSHEIGHFLMHRNQLYGCTNISEIGTTRINDSSQEREANSFASEYLIPHLQLSEMLPRRPLQFSDISQIATYFDVSMTFSAIKSVQLSNTEAELLLCYEGQTLKWFSSCDKNLHYDSFPAKCPIDLDSACEKTDIYGAWDSLFDGIVHQEIFHPIQNQSLILLSGIRCNTKEDYNEL